MSILRVVALEWLIKVPSKPCILSLLRAVANTLHPDCDETVISQAHQTDQGYENKAVNHCNLLSQPL